MRDDSGKWGVEEGGKGVVLQVVGGILSLKGAVTLSKLGGVF